MSANKLNGFTNGKPKEDHSKRNGNGVNGGDEYPEGTKHADGTVRLRNPHISLMDEDILYHLAIGSKSHDLREMFSDVKFICMGGTPQRMENFAHFLMDEIGFKLPAGLRLNDISALSCRYSLYKVGPVLSVSHGMGVPSIGILLHEMIKLCYHAKCKDPVFIRIGTCGGIGVEGGTVVVSNDAVDGLMRSTYEMTILGKTVYRPAKLDQQLVKDLQSLAQPDDGFETIAGKTMCANDFYEGQGRLDGAFCEYGEEEKMEFLRKLRDFGVVNIEMECTTFGAMTYQAGIRGAIVCVALLNRLHGDQVQTPKSVMAEWQNRPGILVARLIRKHLYQQGELEKLDNIPVTIRCPERYRVVRQATE